MSVSQSAAASNSFVHDFNSRNPVLTISSSFSSSSVGSVPVPERPRSSHELHWHHVDRPRFYSLLLLSNSAIRLCFYPAALIKTRIQTDTGPLMPANNNINDKQKINFGGRSEAAVITHHGSGSGGGSAAIAARPHSHSFRSIAGYIIKQQGIFGLYRGLQVNIFGVLVDPINIAILEYCRTSLTELGAANGSRDDRARSTKQTSSQLPFLAPLPLPLPLSDAAITALSACTATLISQTINVPIDVLTQRMMIMNGNISAFCMIRSIFGAEGIRGFYRGYCITIAGAVPFGAIQWSVYWPLQNYLQSLVHNSTGNRTVDQCMHALCSPICAFIAAACACVSTQPIDTIKTRIQTMGSATAHASTATMNVNAHAHADDNHSNRSSNQTFVSTRTNTIKPSFVQTVCSRSSILSTARDIMVVHGAGGFMAGTVARLISVAPGMCILLSAYEAIKRFSAI